MSLSALTPREREIVTAIVRGYSEQEIADLHGISVKTVWTLRRRATERLGIENNMQLFALALRDRIAAWDPASHPTPLACVNEMIDEVLPS